MPEALTTRGALPAGTRPRGVTLAERRQLGKIDLRGDPADRAFMSGVGRAVDLLLPSEPNTTTAKNALTALWLGPDHWLLTCPATDTVLFIKTLRDALGDTHAAITDVTDGRVAFHLAGPSARDLLAKGCPLDLHPGVCKPGQCAQSLLAKTGLLLHCLDNTAAAASFDLYVGRSFARYAFAWLEDAGREYGMMVGAPDA